MKYRSVALDKEKKHTNFIFIYFFIAIISVFIFFVIHTNSQVKILKTTEIPRLKTELEIIKNSIGVENKNKNKSALPISIKKKAKAMGMIPSSNIIWWNKGK